MSSNLHKAGKAFLNQLARNADLLMDTYLSGTVNETEENAKAVAKLTSAGVLRRGESDEPLRLAPNIKSMLEEALQDEKGRQVDTNIGSALATIKTLARHYKEAVHLHDYPGAEAHLGELSELVFNLKESLRHATRSLWSRINNEFGYVGTMDAKIRENELAQTQVTELLASLELFRFDELTELAGDLRDLRRLLVVSLQHTMVECTGELAVVQSRLLALLGRFREIQGRTRLLKGFLLHTQQHPDYRVGEHTHRVNVPALFNTSDACIQSAAVDVGDASEERTLIELVGLIRRRERPDAAKLAEADAFALGQTEAFELADEGLKNDVDAFFIAVIDQASSLSALEYLQEKQLPWPPESWLYQVIGNFDSLPLEQREHFGLDPALRDDPIFSGNKYIEDVHIWLN
ncbi:phosphoenolpyruvate carboxylase [Ferrimonas balearica]|uniref:phosphoenolpyruvate carboxylase n=1 Tax=Ferrimonas balearica TaxID=44012 RepID=UPI001C99D702|nr:phosphoenolpyruvate carboxylase [Ferrimonas balearica]MBY5991302.1 phosphoenolpyruvate carboxylase [Ferrimonas balearica]